MCHKEMLLVILLINNTNYAMHSDQYYGTFPQSTSFSQKLKHCCTKSFVCVRISAALLLIFVPALVGFITPNIACYDNNSHNAQKHAQVGELIHQILVFANGTA